MIRKKSLTRESRIGRARGREYLGIPSAASLWTPEFETRTRSRFGTLVSAAVSDAWQRFGMRKMKQDCNTARSVSA
jgi:hypothetical protein